MSSSISLQTWIRHAPWKKYVQDGLRAIVKSPVHFVVFFLALNVVCWGAFLVLLLAGWVQVGDSAQQKLWIEICSQVINTIFTLAAVPVHPKRLLGLVRALTIWRHEAGIRTQFLALFLDAFHQTRLLSKGQEEKEAQEKGTGPPPQRTLQVSKKEMLEMLDYFNAFPAYGRDRAVAAVSTSAPLKKLSGGESISDKQVIGASSFDHGQQQHKEMPVGVKPPSSTTTTRSTVLNKDDDNDNNDDEPLQQQHPLNPPPPLPLSRQPTSRSTLQVDIPEQELHSLLAQETQRLVHSVVLPFLPVTPPLSPAASHAPVLDTFIQEPIAATTPASAPPCLFPTTTTTYTNTAGVAAPLASQSPSSTRLVLGHRRTQSSAGLPRRLSSRTCSRTHSMIVKEENEEAEEEEKDGGMDKAGNKGRRGTLLPRRSTFVILETDETRPGFKVNKKKKDDDDDDGNSRSSNSSTKATCLEPLPLTLEQIEWLDERQRGLIERQARLQRSWPWYTYTMPDGVEPVDFMASRVESPSEGSLAEHGEETKEEEEEEEEQSTVGPRQRQRRQGLVELPTSKLLMRSWWACVLLASFNLNSMVQEVLCGFMWGWNYKTRPGWVVGTGVAFGCLTAVFPSIMILIHEHRLSKVRVVATTEEAIQQAIDAQPKS